MERLFSRILTSHWAIMGRAGSREWGTRRLSSGHAFYSLSSRQRSLPGTAKVPSGRNKKGSLCVTAKPVLPEQMSHPLVGPGELPLHLCTFPSSPSPPHCPPLAPVPRSQGPVVRTFVTPAACDKKLAQGTSVNILLVKDGDKRPG